MPVVLLMRMMTPISSLEEVSTRLLSADTTRMDGWKIFPASILGDRTMDVGLIWTVIVTG